MSQLTKLDQQLATAKSVKELFTMDMVQERFIKNYEATTGRKDGANRFEQERFAYLEAIAEKPEYSAVDKFYHFAAIIKAGTTGLSFRDKSLYLIPITKKVENEWKIVGFKVDSSPAGKRKEMEMMPDVKSFPEAILVMKGDVFVHDKLNNRVIEHRTTDKSSETLTLDNIRASYQRIIYHDKTIYDVVVYHDELVKAKAKSKMKSEDGLWNTWPGEASKKTATNRAYNRYHKYPDGAVTLDVPEGDDPDEPETIDQNASIQEATIVTTPAGDQVDQGSGEVVVNKSPEKLEPPKKSFME